MPKFVRTTACVSCNPDRLLSGWSGQNFSSDHSPQTSEPGGSVCQQPARSGPQRHIRACPLLTSRAACPSTDVETFSSHTVAAQSQMGAWESGPVQRVESCCGERASATRRLRTTGASDDGVTRSSAQSLRSDAAPPHRRQRKAHSGYTPSQHERLQACEFAQCDVHTWRGTSAAVHSDSTAYLAGCLRISESSLPC